MVVHVHDMAMVLRLREKLRLKVLVVPRRACSVDYVARRALGHCCHLV